MGIFLLSLLSLLDTSHSGFCISKLGVGGWGGGVFLFVGGEDLLEKWSEQVCGMENVYMDVQLSSC